MDPAWSIYLGVAQGVIVLLVSVVGWFLKGMAEKHRGQEQAVNDLEKDHAVLRAEMSVVTGMQADVKSLSKDIQWIREKMAAAQIPLSGGGHE
jgi:septation ring formation regulator EzrA